MTFVLFAARLRGAYNRLRTEPLGLLQGLVVLAALCTAAAWLGLDTSREVLTRAGNAELAWKVLRERVFLAVGLNAFVIAYGAMDALLRPPDGALLLALPVGPWPRLWMAGLDAATRALPLTLCAAAYALPLFFLGAPTLGVRALVLVVGGALLALWGGLGLGALAGRAAASTAGHGVKQALAGGWVAADRAPLLYAPGFGGGLAAFLAVPMQVSLDDWPGDPVAAVVGVGVVLAVALAVAVFGAFAYKSGFGRIGPILESVDARYPLSPAAGEEEGVYGESLLMRLGGVTGAVAERDLRSVRRRHRSEPLLLLALGLVTALTLARTEQEASAFALAAVAVGLFGARLGVRLGEPDLEVPWLVRALPLPWHAFYWAKVAVTLFHALHAAAAFALVAALSGRGAAAALALCAALLAAAAAPALALACAGRPRMALGLALPLGAGVALAAAVSPWLLSLPILGAVALGGAALGARVLSRGVS